MHNTDKLIEVISLNKEISMDKMKDFLNLFAPCMNDYLFAYDLKNDRIVFSNNTLDKFNLETIDFTNVIYNFRKFVYVDDYDLLANDLNSIIKGESDIHNIIYRWIDKKYEAVWINCIGRIIKYNNEARYLIGCINEISRKWYIDSATGLVGEVGMRQYFIDNSNANGGTIMLLGIDDFKSTIEKNGIDYGTFILKRVANTIKSILNDNQKIFKYEYDQFIIVDLLGNIDTVKECFNKIKNSLAELYKRNNYEFNISVSAGAYFFKDGENNYSDFMKKTYYALEKAHDNGCGKLHFYNEEEYQLFIRKSKIIEKLRLSTKYNFSGFELYYQPIFKDDELEGVEALLRYSCDELGRIYPNEFIPCLEESGLIIPVGVFIIKEAICMLKILCEKYPNINMHINISYKQVLNSNVIYDILDTIKEYNVNPKNVVCELTESGFLENNDALKEFCNVIKENGLKIALDDFGTGYSNFHYLAELKPDMIKIDRGFTYKALNNEYDNLLINNVIRMAHTVGIKACIEGIETRDELNKINSLFPDLIQGYYYDMPLPKKSFLEKYCK